LPDASLHDVVGGDHVAWVDFDRRYDLDARIAEAEGSGREAVARNLRRLRSRAGVLVADAAGHRVTDALVAAMLHQAFLLGVNYELDLFGEVTTPPLREPQYALLQDHRGEQVLHHDLRGDLGRREAAIPLGRTPAAGGFSRGSSADS
jgi:hypothetical protein